jgi:predicted ATP-dependent endonuclease of OLD family
VLNVKLKWIEFENLRTGLKIERVVFNDDITLLVGLSGVGKTQILNAIEYSLKLAVNKNLRLEPYNTTLCFQIGEEVYVWSYRIQQDHTEDIFESKEIKYFFAYEKLQNIKGDILMQRTSDTIQVTGYDKVPTPKKDESLLVQYSEDAFVKPIISEMLKLYPIEIEMDVRGAIAQESFNMFKAKIKESFKENEKQPFEKFSHLPVPLKIYITKKYYPQMYAQIFSAVKELFMEINSIDIVEDPDREIYMVAIDVYGKRLLQHEISNGMLKTIYYIVELITMSKNSLVLIDEFENGLGVNCIDVLAELLLGERRDLQFVITSHHPKIINQISNKKWKIIERDIATVKNFTAEEYGIMHSQHDAYFNLINRWEFEGKI